jgi:putative membrane protein
MMGRFRPARALTSIVLGAALALSTAACDDDDSTGTDDQFELSPISSDANIVALAHESNVGEIQAGQVAQAKASDAEVVAFADAMVTEHTTLDQEGTALAQQLAIAAALPDNNLPQLQATELAALNATAAGATFDRVYIAQQVAAHRRTLDLIDAGIDRAQRAELRAALSADVRPHVAEHLDMAEAIQSRIGPP